MVLAAEFPAIPSSAVKIASERRCAILVHSGVHWIKLRLTLLPKSLAIAAVGGGPLSMDSVPRSASGDGTEAQSLKVALLQSEFRPEISMY